jgi:hypothetical protein
MTVYLTVYLFVGCFILMSILVCCILFFVAVSRDNLQHKKELLRQESEIKKRIGTELVESLKARENLKVLTYRKLHIINNRKKILEEFKENA